MQKGMRLNDGHVAYLALLAKREGGGARRGYLSKRSSDNTKWHARYRNLATEHETLMQKYLHLLQIVETEKTVAKQLRQQIEDGEIEIERLKSEIAGLLKDNEKIQATPEWKTIIQDYIRSPHAESMRKRNQVVFSMLEAEAEYVQQLHILVNNFLRPLRMAASSKKPPITHDDVSSIFLNSETIMFLHQIFYQGLKARIASWPTLVLADLFDILLPMLNIYQEFVRNHQYSLQILAHCKQNRDFDKLLKQYEAKPDCEERTLETFLTYPMFQIPRYILTLHELLAHTPHEHVERNSLDYAKSKLEELSSSLELFFASSQSNKLLYGEPPKSPRASRKFSSPPPLSITKSSSSSPNRRRKLSLNIPIITGGKALELAALSCSPNGYAGMHSAMSPFSKTALDINKLYVTSKTTTAAATPDDTADAKAEDSPLSKQDLAVKEVCDEEDPTPSDEVEAEMSPPKSPSTPKNIQKSKNSEFSLFSFNNGMVVSSCRELDNNRSALSAASAFAIATAGANDGTPTKEKYRRMSLASTGFPTDQRNGDKEFVIRRAATNRVLNVLRHWVSKHAQDFELNTELKLRVISFLEEVMHDPELLTQERKAAANIIRTLTQEDPGDHQISLEEITQMGLEGGKSEPFESHSALEIAEQLTLLDHLVFKVIPYEEFFGQGWMKNDKNERTPNLIATEILKWDDMGLRVGVLEKWVAVADICRCLHNYNAVLEITSSLNRSSVFRLKKTWLKVSKQTKTVIDKLQKLVSSEGRFKNLREALKKYPTSSGRYVSSSKQLTRLSISQRQPSIFWTAAVCWTRRVSTKRP
ncbi:hypothetical protein CRUP_003515 [Coryphaenoides rupestris]|nr:hypothetical protein CRUP_003515 [Coryphaenoides rupestris]